MNPAKLLERRLDAQRISASAFTRPDEAVAWLGAVQAQDYLGALWAVGLRVVGARELDVERALADRTIVRTWPMRGTLHFVAAADARWMTETLGPRVIMRAAGRLRRLELDAATLGRARSVLEKRLAGGRALARPALYDVLERSKISTAEQRGMHILWHLAHECVLCFGPREGKQHTFVLFDEWLPGAKRRAREDALGELASRYFTGHGPATAADFAWWSGMKLSDAHLAIHLAGKRLERETIDGQTYWFGAAAAPTAAASRPRAHLLPAYDEFLVAYADRSAAVGPARSGRGTSFGVLLNPTILIDGRVVGTWKRRLARTEVTFAPAPFEALGKAKERSVALAFRRYAEFLGLNQGSYVLADLGVRPR